MLCCAAVFLCAQVSDTRFTGRVELSTQVAQHATKGADSRIRAHEPLWVRQHFIPQSEVDRAEVDAWSKTAGPAQL